MMGIALLCGVRATEAQSARHREHRADTLRDSATLRVLLHSPSVERWMRELLSSREMERVMALSLNEATSGSRMDSRRTRELSDSVRDLARRSAELMTKIQMECVNEGPLPEGYLGVRFDQQSISRQDNEPAMYELGTIESVEPGSPAERAGLERGDLLLSIGGTDARKPIALATILKPGTHVKVRLQRGRSIRDVTVLVKRRPRGYGSDCANVEQLIGPERDAPVIRLQRLFSPSSRGVTVAPPPGMPAPLPPQPRALGGFGYQFAPTVSTAIAGATLMPLDDDWRQSLGVDNGLLVMRVLPGTSARDAGLRGNDVIISVDGQVVGSVPALQRIISNAKASAVRVQVVRGGKTQTLTLRWHDQ